MLELLLSTHCIADFFLQSNWMALKKGENSWEGIRALTLHVLIYSLCFLWMGLTFVALTAITHWLTDFVTSRLTKRWWFLDSYGEEPASGHLMVELNPRKRVLFWRTIGVDQWIHAITLLQIARYLNG